MLYNSLGMDFDSTDSDGWTCITALALNAAHSPWRGHLFLLYSLLAGGCNASSRNTTGENSFHAILNRWIRYKSRFLWYDDIYSVQEGLFVLLGNSKGVC